MPNIKIVHGFFRKHLIENTDFTLIHGLDTGARTGEKFVTVSGPEITSKFGYPAGEVARIKVNGPDDFIITGSFEIAHTSPRLSEKAHNKSANAATILMDDVPEVESNESDIEIVNRINKKFDMLGKFTWGAVNGYIRSLVVTGAPGVGKTYGVEKVFEQVCLKETMGSENPSFQVISGTMSPIGLYIALYKHSDEGKVLVLDDCDDVFMEQDSLNLLKCALDTKETRKIFWSTDSKLLTKMNIPEEFDFKGSVIFISNLDFKRVRGYKMQAHIAALMSRSHFLDLTIHTQRERMLRIQSVIETGNILTRYKLPLEVQNQIKDFIYTNVKNFNELSLRTVVKIAELAACNTDNWKDMASESLLGNVMGY